MLHKKPKTNKNIVLLCRWSCKNGLCWWEQSFREPELALTHLLDSKSNHYEWDSQKFHISALRSLKNWWKNTRCYSWEYSPNVSIQLLDILIRKLFWTLLWHSYSLWWVYKIDIRMSNKLWINSTKSSIRVRWEIGMEKVIFMKWEIL